MKVLGIDPGKNTGFYACEYDPTSKEFQHLHVWVTHSVDDALAHIQKLGETLIPDVWVVEDYVINAHNSKGAVYKHSHVNDSGDTLRVIGFAQAEARRLGGKLVLQRATDKPAAYGFLGEKYIRGKKDQHALDAKAHAIFHLVTKHGMSPAACRKMLTRGSDQPQSFPPKSHP